MRDLLLLAVGVGCAAAGGDLFLRGVLGLSAWLRIPRAVTAATLAAFATSSPEVSVAVNAAAAGTPQIALGDALGSNLVNVGLVMGVVLCMGRLPFAWAAVRREFGLALALPVVLLAILWDGRFTRGEAVACLLVFAGWLLVAVREARRARAGAEPTVTRRQGWAAVGLAAAGLLVQVAAGRLIVDGASGLGRSAGMDPFLIGATLVALGTSAPELATAVVAKLRGHDEVGVGTVLGSNIFNCLFVVGLAGLLQPFDEPVGHVLSSLLFGAVMVACLVPFRGSHLPRWRGILLLNLYLWSVVVAWFTQRGIDGG